MLTPEILVAFILLDFKVLNFITPMQGQHIEEKKAFLYYPAGTLSFFNNYVFITFFCFQLCQSSSSGT